MPITGVSVAGSIWIPKYTKNSPPKTSRTGISTSRPRSATWPDSVTPSRNAPTAADTWISSARPATNSVRPRIVSSRSSSDRVSRSRLTWVLYRAETASAIATTPRATPTDTTPSTIDAPMVNTPAIGRKTAIEMSSRTSTESTTGVSRFAIRPKSESSLAMIPDDDM